MSFTPRPDRLLPPLSARDEVVILARTLWREGYDDHLAGHITYRMDDDTFLTNPWLLLWDEFGPDDVVRIDLDGTVVEGDWPAAPGVALHLALHRARPNVRVAVHNHPRWATTFANLRRVPGCYDQSSALGGGRVVVVDEYRGGVQDTTNADAAVAAMGDADIALLAGHGLFVLGDSIREAHQRAVAFEIRCHHAWLVEQSGGDTQIAPEVQEMLGGAEFFGYWEAMARRELRADPVLAARIEQQATTSGGTRR